MKNTFRYMVREDRKANGKPGDYVLNSKKFDSHEAAMERVSGVSESREPFVFSELSAKSWGVYSKNYEHKCPCVQCQAVRLLREESETKRKVA